MLKQSLFPARFSILSSSDFPTNFLTPRYNFNAMEKSLLTVDLGNTRINLGVFEGEKLLVSFFLPSKETLTPRLLKEKLEKKFLALPKRKYLVVYSSVVPSFDEVLVPFFESWSGQKILKVDSSLPLSLKFKIDDRNEVGSDLIAASIGAKSLYKTPLFIADMGTAAKYIYLDEEGAFRGLAIASGLSLSYEALLKRTGTLGNNELSIPKKALGTNTRACLDSGAIFGKMYEALGFYQTFKGQKEEMPFILTGGDSEYLLPLLNDFSVQYEPALLLKGLQKIYEELDL